MHIVERLGCTAESGIWGHAYEAFKGGEHRAFFPWGPLERRGQHAPQPAKIRAPIPRPRRAVCNFPRQGDPTGETPISFRWVDKSHPFVESGST